MADYSSGSWRLILMKEDTIRSAVWLQQSCVEPPQLHIDRYTSNIFTSSISLYCVLLYCLQLRLLLRLGAMFAFHMSLPIVLSRKPPFLPISSILAALYRTDKLPNLFMNVIVMPLHILVRFKSPPTNPTCYWVSVWLLMTAGINVNWVVKMLKKRDRLTWIDGAG